MIDYLARSTLQKVDHVNRLPSLAYIPKHTLKKSLCESTFRERGDWTHTSCINNFNKSKKCIPHNISVKLLVQFEY